MTTTNSEAAETPIRLIRTQSPCRRPDLAASDRGGEHCQRCGQDTARGGTVFPLRKYFRGGKPQGLLRRMNDKSLAAGPETGSLSRDEVDRNASKDGKNEQNGRERESRFRNERQHHKRLIPTRCDHRCDYRTDGDGAMGIERDDGERSKTARRCPEERRQQVLTDSTAREPLAPLSAAEHVEILDQQHHRGHKTGDHQAVEYQACHRAPYRFTGPFSGGAPSNRSSATRRREFDSSNHPALLCG